MICICRSVIPRVLSAEQDSAILLRPVHQEEPHACTKGSGSISVDARNVWPKAVANRSTSHDFPGLYAADECQ